MYSLTKFLYLKSVRKRKNVEPVDIKDAEAISIDAETMGTTRLIFFVLLPTIHNGLILSIVNMHFAYSGASNFVSNKPMHRILFLPIKYASQHLFAFILSAENGSTNKRRGGKRAKSSPILEASKKTSATHDSPAKNTRSKCPPSKNTRSKKCPSAKSTSKKKL